MGFVNKTPAGTYRANWRDATGKQKAKTFRTKKEATVYLADVESAVNRGTYVDPHAGKMRFGEFAARWLASRTVEARTAERTLSLMRTHVLPRWTDWPLSKIEFMAVQEWVSTLGRDLAPATVAKCHGLMLMILKTAVQARLIAVNPAEGVKVPRDRAGDVKPATITREAFFGKLLPAVPPAHRAIVCAAAGAGLRWGECAGLPWSAVDLERGVIKVAQVAVETHGGIAIRPYPKSRAGVRAVPIPGFLAEELGKRKRDHALVFADRTGHPMRRSNFRRRVWLPSLVRAGLLGDVAQMGPHKYRATWPDQDGFEWSAEFTTYRDAVAHVASKAVGGLRFHDLRHSYATWLITDGVPVNVVQAVMGHEQASTTLNRYTHTPADYAKRVREALADDLLTFRLGEDPQRTDQGSDQGVKRFHNEDDPRRGEAGVVWGPAPGGSSRNPLSGHGGCNRREPSRTRRVGT
ncbi:site-specific integrase [Phytohabitans sp. ZYX-F-186]|uniref:Site-specific integrase n=1 Tax=Phytohabitans maris TaxID=3071409 RepID=A0ABU0ZMV3_9ACTN|nr:site-specific integrase [Phytohabitans sp. ZYX-F-186]MDQ7908369.1 site-specific integrase [Phytohabitans sp. ZYX-F-186]